MRKDAEPLPDTERIRELNDTARKTFTGATIVATAAFAAQSEEWRAKALARVRTFQEFDGDNDPHGEHDFAFMDVDGERLFWKFDYYELSMQSGSEDPSDPTKTRRVLTIGMASDY